jgi:tetratricopeptide (TPR) repeat protein
VIAIPLTSASLVRESQDDVGAGDLAGALDAARSAERVQPYAATPYLQEALVLELRGELTGAATQARAATRREATNWRTWLILSRLDAERGDVRSSIAAYRRARALNPRSPLFARGTR